MNKRLFFILMITLCSILITADSEESKSSLVPDIEKIDPYSDSILNSLNQNLYNIKYKGDIAYKRGDYYEAAQYYIASASMNQGDEYSYYNLACCYARLNKPSLAVGALRLAIAAGLDDLELISKDKDFDSIRSNSEFKQLMVIIENLDKNSGTPVYLKNISVLKGRVHLPQDYDKSKKYKLLIGLHGHGDTAHNFALNWIKIKRKDFIFLSPEAPYRLNDIQAKRDIYAWFFPTRDRDLWRIADPLVVDYITGAVKQMKETYNISEVYLLGFSEGVAASFFSALKHPDLFKGVIAFAGILPDKEFVTDEEIRNAKSLKVFFAHGKRDRAIKPQETEKVRERLTEQGLKVIYKTFNDGHTVDTDILNEAIDWMLEK